MLLRPRQRRGVRRRGRCSLSGRCPSRGSDRLSGSDTVAATDAAIPAKPPWHESTSTTLTAIPSPTSWTAVKEPKIVKLKEKDDRRTVADYPVPRGIDGEELVNAVSSWMQPVGVGRGLRRGQRSNALSSFFGFGASVLMVGSPCRLSVWWSRGRKAWMDSVRR